MLFFIIPMLHIITLTNHIHTEVGHLLFQEPMIQVIIGNYQFILIILQAEVLILNQYHLPLHHQYLLVQAFHLVRPRPHHPRLLQAFLRHSL